MATHVSKTSWILLLFLFALSGSCTKNKQVYYSPNQSGKQTIALAQLNQVDVTDLVLADTFKQIDSPIINSPEKNKAIIKKYSFDEDTVGDKQQEKKSHESVTPKPKPRKNVGLITGIVLAGIGILWMILAGADDNLKITDSIFSGCIGVFLSLILTFTGILTIAISLFTSY